jgi:hypothetical protein
MKNRLAFRGNGGKVRKERRKGRKKKKSQSKTRREK